MSEQLGAMDDGNAVRARGGNVGNLLLDRSRDDERRAIGADAAPSCGMTAMPRRSSCSRNPARSPWSKARSLPLTRAATHHLELCKRAHAGARRAPHNGIVRASSDREWPIASGSAMST